MFLGLKNGGAKYLLLAVIVLTDSCLWYACLKWKIFTDFGGYQISVDCTLIGKNNTPIAKTARLLVL